MSAPVLALAAHNPDEFRDKVVLVSGAARGIGAAVAAAFATRGAHLALLDSADIPPLPADGTSAQARRLSLAVDVRHGGALEQAVARTENELGPIDVLVNVAGILRLGAIVDLNPCDWDDSFAVNATAVFRLSRAVAARMLPRRRGCIVTVGSNAAVVPRLQMAAYAASKAASAQFMRCLALELAPAGIRCNVVSPGSTDTAMQRQLWQQVGGTQSVLRGSADSFRLGIPLGRIADPQDIAEAVCFLASERARHITMHDLRVDGGATFDA